MDTFTFTVIRKINMIHMKFWETLLYIIHLEKGDLKISKIKSLKYFWKIKKRYTHNKYLQIPF